MAVIAVKSDYIVKANEVYGNLKEAEEVFAKEAAVLNHVKCVLVRNEELLPFSVSGISVDVYETREGYDLYFDGYVMTLTVYDRQVIDYRLIRS